MNSPASPSFWGDNLARIDMQEDRHLCVNFGPASGDYRVVIIDKERDVRICDGASVVKVRFEGQKIKDILVDDIFVYPADKCMQHTP